MGKVFDTNDNSPKFGWLSEHFGWKRTHITEVAVMLNSQHLG